MPADALTWPQALAWRMRRQLLDPPGEVTATEVVRTLGVVPAAHDDAVQLALGTRRRRPAPGDVQSALAAGDLVTTFAFRGATHLMAPEEASVYLALRAASRMWELPSWQTFYGLTPDDWPQFRHAVRAALADGPLTSADLGTALTADARYRHLREVFAGDPWTLLKALAWQGDLSIGPSHEGRATLQRLDRNPRWTGLADLDEAGASAIQAYVRAYGPTTPARLQYWLGEGLGVGRGRLRSWVASLGETLAEVEVDGEPALVLRTDLEELTGTAPSNAVRLLPRYDQWVLGPGTADPHVVPPASRGVVSRGANVVIVGGVVTGTWAVVRGEIDVTWFAGTRPPASEALSAEIDRVGEIMARQD